MPLPVSDTDIDSVNNFRDLDSENDGIPDLTESQGAGNDLDGDGMIDNFIDADGDGLDDNLGSNANEFIDTDGDAIPDHLDLDSDGDGVFDLVEVDGVDANGDGIVDSMTDSDADGIPDSVDVDVTGGIDIDGDGIDDTADSDQTGLPDTDNDGIANELDPDSDGDGFTLGGDDTPTLGAAIPDIDANGTPDFQQVSSGEFITGVNGNGCVIGLGTTLRDPMWLLLILFSLIGLLWRSQIARIVCTKSARIER